MSLPCKQPDCDGEVKVGACLDRQISRCLQCGHAYKVWGDESYDDETGDCFDWWALTEPGATNPWVISRPLETHAGATEFDVLKAQRGEPAWRKIPDKDKGEP